MPETLGVEDRIKKVVAKHFGVETAELNHDTTFVNDLGADSLDIGELEMALDDEFPGIETEVRIEEVKNVGQLVDYMIKLNPA